MELPDHQQGEIPIPINSSYGGHMIHHDHAPHTHIPSNGPMATALGDSQEHVPYKKMVRYRECLKNHAAAMGGNATDGCGEFMPSGEEGTIEALTCSACSCHRNFHRKEVEGEPSNSFDCFPSPYLNRVSRKMILGHTHKSILAPEALGYPTPGAGLIPSRGHHQLILSYNNLGLVPSESDEQEDGGGGGGDGGGGGGGFVARPPHLVKKRFRTKFTQEQKEKMLSFAEKVEWRIQKQEEAVVQQFCQEIGVKRRVLKVWMHNNKHNLAKKNLSIAPNPI